MDPGAPLPPLLTADLPGTGGSLRRDPGDFVVEEIPLYRPSGAGDHAYAWIEKTGISTHEAVRRIAARLQVSEGRIGFAGLKDARAVTRQMLSLERVSPAAVESLEVPGVRVLRVVPHRNKLRVGHLAGNRFLVRVRDVVPDATARVEAVLRRVLARGLPNGFGPQRFGTRGDTHLLGRALVRRDAAEATDVLLGRPSPRERDPRVVEARRLYGTGDYRAARELLPPGFAAERRALERLAAGGTREEAQRAIPRGLRRFFVGAYQAALFNRVLGDRIGDIDRLEAGDLAWIHGRGAVFLVEDPAREQPRCDRFEVSPSGPLFGTKMILPGGAPGERERAVLAAEGLEAASFRVEGADRFEGERRPLRVPVAEPSFRVEGGDLVLGFALPRGAYATNLLAEIMKGEASAEGPEL